MKIGDLVRLLQEPEVLKTNPEIPSDSIGIVVEEPSQTCFQSGGAMFVEDLEVISASR